MKIRTAIFLVYVAASAVGFAVLMRFVLAEVRPRYVAAVRQSMQEAVQMVAKGLAGRTEPEVVAVLAGESTYRVKLLGADGRLRFESQGSVAAMASGLDPYEVRADSGLAKRMGDRVLDGGRMDGNQEISVTTGLQLAGGNEVELVFSRSFRGINAVIWSERKKLAGAGLLVAAVMVVAGWWIAARLTRSLERLTVYAQGVRDGRSVVPPASRAAEIAALGTAFEEMRDALEGRQHAERYAQALAHEVKAPLAAIRGAAELMDETMPPEQRRKFLGNIRSEAARIQQIVERLLELSSIEARKALRQTEPVDAGGLAAEAVAALRPAFEAGRVTLNLEAGTAALRGERVLLREALVNLLQNALDFSPAGGVVTLRGALAAGRVVFTVEDGGPGVPDYALPRVFERFYSLPRPGTERKSTGLGLALVREIAHLHGGDVTLGNRPEGGARATLWIPTES